jgi:hypothetical protein
VLVTVVAVTDAVVEPDELAVDVAVALSELVADEDTDDDTDLLTVDDTVDVCVDVPVVVTLCEAVDDTDEDIVVVKEVLTVVVSVVVSVSVAVDETVDDGLVTLQACSVPAPNSVMAVFSDDVVCEHLVVSSSSNTPKAAQPIFPGFLSALPLCGPFISLTSALSTVAVLALQASTSFAAGSWTARVIFSPPEVKVLHSSLPSAPVHDSIISLIVSISRSQSRALEKPRTGLSLTVIH